LKPVPKAALRLFLPETAALGFEHCAKAALVEMATEHTKAINAK
jgi:hypothetical protein